MNIVARNITIGGRSVTNNVQHRMHVPNFENADVRLQMMNLCSDYSNDPQLKVYCPFDTALMAYIRTEICYRLKIDFELWLDFSAESEPQDIDNGRQLLIPEMVDADYSSYLLIYFDLSVRSEMTFTENDFQRELPETIHQHVYTALTNKLPFSIRNIEIVR